MMDYFNDFKKLKQYKKDEEHTYYLITYEEYKFRELWGDVIDKTITVLEVRNTPLKNVPGCYIHGMFGNYPVHKDENGEYFELPFGDHVYLYSFTWV